MIHADRRALSARALSNLAKIGLLSGTALAAVPAVAQNVSYNGPGPYTLTQTSPISGGPRAIDVTVTSSDATVDTTATTITSTNNGTAAGVGIGVNNTGAGSVTVRSGDITANGSGPNTGIDARANAGTITIVNKGTINASGNNSDRGIVARSGGGDVVINSNVANGQQYGIIVTGNGGTFGSTGTTTITSTSASANGTGMVNAIVGQGYRVVINSGTATNTNAGGVQGTAIFANASAGGVLINAGTTNAFGQNQAALQVFSEGAVDVTSGAIRTTQNSDGLSIQSGTDVVVRSTSIVTEGSGGARGLLLGGNGGGGGFNGGPNGFAYNSAVVTSGSITTAGNGAYGIYATPNGTGSTTLNSGAITTTGPNAYGIYVTAIGSGVVSGPVTINSTGSLQTSGASSSGIRYNGGTGALTINNSGTISTGGTDAGGIVILNSNGATVTSNAVTTNGGGASNGIQVAASAQATNPTAITSGTVNVSNAASTGSGILVTGPGTATNITSGTVTVAGSGNGIDVRTTGAVTIASGTVTATNASSTGIIGQSSGGGNVTITADSTTGGRRGIFTSFSGGVTTINSNFATASALSSPNAIIGQGSTVVVNSGTATLTGNGSNGTAIFVQSGAGGATVNSGTASTQGSGQYGIQVYSDKNSKIDSGSVTTSGTNAVGIYSNATAANVVKSVSVTTSSSGATGIYVSPSPDTAANQPSAGTVTVDSGTIKTTGNSANGITVSPQTPGGQTAASLLTGAINVTSKAISATGNGSIGIRIAGANPSSIAGAVAVQSTDIASWGNGIDVSSAKAVTVSSGTITTSNGSGINIFADSGPISVTSGAVTVGGTLGNGIRAQSATGDIAVTSGTVSSSAGTGIVALNGSGGSINVASDKVTITSGQSASAMQVIAYKNATVTSNSVASSGNGASAIDVRSLYGDTSITAGTTAATGTTANGFAANAILASGNATSVTSTNASAKDGDAINASGQTVSVTSGTAAGGGAGHSAIRASGTAGVTVVAADSSSNGASFQGGARSDAIAAGSMYGVLTVNAGTVSATGAGSYGIYATNGTGPVVVTTTGLVSSTNGGGIYVNAQDKSAVVSGTVVAGNGSAIRVDGSLGDVAVKVSDASVTATNANNGNSVGILATTTSGAIKIDAAKVTTSAAGAGIQANSGSGAITINSGTVSALSPGNRATGIIANSTNGGTVTVNADQTSGTLRGIFTAFSGGTTTINSNFATASGLSSPNAIIGQGSTVVVNSGTATLTGNGSQGTAIFVQSGNGGATVNSGTASTQGLGQNGIQLFSFTTGKIDSGTVTTAGNFARGIYSNATTDNVVKSGTVATTGDSATGIYVSPSPQSANGPASGSINVTSGTVTTSGANAAGILVTPVTPTGNGSASLLTGATVIASDTVKTSGTGSTGIDVGGTTGAVSIVSNLVDTQGAGAAAIRVAGGSGDVSLQSGTATTAGLGARGIFVQTTSGNITINAGTTSAALGDAIFATGGGNVGITATTATAAGDGAGGVAATGGTGVTLNIGSASSTGTATTNGTTVSRADAIFAQATTGAIAADVGSAKALGAGADGIRLIANGAGGAVTLNVTGSVSSAGGNGIFIDPPGAVKVNVAAGASVSGASAGLNTTGGTNSIVNLGSISGTGGPGILASGPTLLDNSGAIAGTNGLAVQLGASDDSVVLRTGSSVTGTIAGGGGTDVATLIGSGTAASAAQTVATFDGFSRLNVSSGYWTASSAPSSFGSVVVASASILELRSVTGASGLSIAAPTIEDAGTLVVRTAAGAASSFGSTRLAGAGLFNVVGAGTLTVATDNSGFTGKTLVGGGTLQLTGTLGTVETAQGGTFVLGAGGTAGNVTGDVIDNGTFVANRSDNYTLAGGLSGNGTFVKQGSGSFTFGGAYTFTGSVNVAGGSLRFAKGLAANSEIDLSGGGKLDLSNQANTVRELAGAAGSIIDVAGGTLTDNQSIDTTFAGSLTGAGGAFVKTGSGTLNLTGTSNYTGATTVTGGTLAVNGSLASTVGVLNGGKLGGNGTVGGIVAGNGGIVGPGNSIGTINVSGNVAFGAGSTFQVEANAAGQADRIVATGTAALTGGTVAVLAQPGTYARVTGYTILTASGGVTGTFANVTSNLAFLTPVLGYSSNAVQLTLARNDIAFSTFAGNANQVRTANAVQALGFGNSLYTLILTQSDAGAGTALASLATELHAGIGTAMIEQERDFREAALVRSRSGAEGTGLWVQGLYDWAHSRGASALRLGVGRKGLLGGIDGETGGLRLGAFGGYVEGDLHVRSQSASAKDRTKLVGLYAGWRAGPLSLAGGANLSWHSVDTNRSIAFPGLSGNATGSYDGQSGQLFGEIAYNLLQGPLRLEPFAGYAHVRSRADAFAETGPAGALNVRRERRDADFATLGLRLGGELAMGTGTTLRPRLSAAWQRGWGDLTGTTTASFGAAGGTFLLTGASVGRDTLVLDAGFDADLGGGLSLGASANVGVSNRWSSTGARATLGLRF